MTDTLIVTETVTPPPPATLPYAFARTGGVLLRGHECLYRGDAPLDALLEVQRLMPSAMFRAVPDAEFDAALSATYGQGAAQAAEFEMDATDLAALADSVGAVDDLLDTRDDSPVIKLINAILLEAVKEGASDVHVETTERRLVVRFRVDGVLRDVVEPQRALAPLLVSRIKVMAKLAIAEKRVPQDGRVTLRIGGHDVEDRVAPWADQVAVLQTPELDLAAVLAAEHQCPAGVADWPAEPQHVGLLPAPSPAPPFGQNHFEQPGVTRAQRLEQADHAVSILFPYGHSRARE